MTLTRFLRALNLAEKQNQLIQSQQALIDNLNRQTNFMALEHVREMRGLVCAWLISLEQPENDMRDDLARMENALRDRVAWLEEHVV